jgi:TPR repeat protein
MVLEIRSITSLLTRWSAPRLRALFGEDPRQAAQWASVLADEGLAAAQLCFGRMLLQGTGVPRDAMAALKCFRRAADNADIDAVNMVGRCLDNGWGTDEDSAAAAHQYRRAADVGHAWAQYNLGHLYLDGRGVARDVDQAYGCYLRAAEQGHERAMNLVGRCCEEGWGTPRDCAAAAGWYRRSAEAGYFRGQYNWASVLLKAGRADEAAAWFERAASGATPSVRSAVIDTIERNSGGAGTDDALHGLAARLKDQITGVASGH